MAMHAIGNFSLHGGIVVRLVQTAVLTYGYNLHAVTDRRTHLTDDSATQLRVCAIYAQLTKTDSHDSIPRRPTNSVGHDCSRVETAHERYELELMLAAVCFVQ